MPYMCTHVFFCLSVQSHKHTCLYVGPCSLYFHEACSIKRTIPLMLSIALQSNRLSWQWAAVLPTGYISSKHSSHWVSCLFFQMLSSVSPTETIRKRFLEQSNIGHTTWLLYKIGVGVGGVLWINTVALQSEAKKLSGQGIVAHMVVMYRG